ncbi:hypothetical protein RB195_009841 [Necator americanus]|uniref:Receptor L domain protein n=1 Tax=Necator americanus TaxID=51031 RepID=A0ABR1CVP9_NECAM
MVVIDHVSPSTPIVVWMQRCSSYVENIPNVLRIKNPTKFGEDVRGIPDCSGELVDVSWELVMGLRPTVLEITDSRNPLPCLTAVLQSIESDVVKTFFGKVKLLSVDKTDIGFNDLIFLLRKLELLEGFSFSELSFTQKEWELMLPEFQRLNLRAMDISEDILDSTLSKTNVELLKLSGPPGIKVDSLKNCAATFVTVSTLAIQELDYVNDRDAEDLINCIEIKFPRLKTLIWDWSIVDPAVTYDERSKTVVEDLVGLFRKMDLQCFAVILYTPCSDTRYASGELARFFAEENLPFVQLNRFASKGLPKGHENFTIISSGQDYATRAKVHSIFVDGRTSAPNLRLLLQLIDDFCPQLQLVKVVEFGGFDGDSNYVASLFTSAYSLLPSKSR